MAELLRIMGGPGISVTKNDVMEPVGDNTLGVHQVTNCLQNSLEIILFGFTSQDNIERLVNIL